MRRTLTALETPLHVSGSPYFGADAAALIAKAAELGLTSPYWPTVTELRFIGTPPTSEASLVALPSRPSVSVVNAEHTAMPQKFHVATCAAEGLAVDQRGHVITHPTQGRHLRALMRRLTSPYFVTRHFCEAMGGVFVQGAPFVKLEGWGGGSWLQTVANADYTNDASLFNPLTCIDPTLDVFPPSSLSVMAQVKLAHVPESCGIFVDVRHMETLGLLAFENATLHTVHASDERQPSSLLRVEDIVDGDKIKEMVKHAPRTVLDRPLSGVRAVDMMQTAMEHNFTSNMWLTLSQIERWALKLSPQHVVVTYPINEREIAFVPRAQVEVNDDALKKLSSQERQRRKDFELNKRNRGAASSQTSPAD